MATRLLVAVAAVAVLVVWLTAVSTSRNMTPRTPSTGTLHVPTFFPQSLAIKDCVGNMCARRAERAPSNGDSVTVVFSAPIKQSTVCSSWKHGTAARSRVTVTITDDAGATGNDVLSVSAGAGITCAGGLKFGTIDLGSPGYVAATTHYPSSTLDLVNAGTTASIVLRLGGGSIGTRPNAPHVPAEYSCDPALASSTGVPCGTSKARAATVHQF